MDTYGMLCRLFPVHLPLNGHQNLTKKHIFGLWAIHQLLLLIMAHNQFNQQQNQERLKFLSI